MTEQDKTLEKLNLIFDECYSKDLSVCEKHTIFQREKAVNLIRDELFPLIREAERGKYREVVEILGDLLDSDNCSLDHHGNCQVHDYSKPCPMPRGKELWQALKGEK